MNSRIEATARAKARTEASQHAKKDFFHYLLNAVDPESGSALAVPELWGEANVLMIAGSDTTSTGLTAVIFYLLRNPAALQKLTTEIRSQFSDVEEIVSGPRLNELSYLKCCIDEAMRLAPAVPVLYREKSRRGLRSMVCIFRKGRRSVRRVIRYIAILSATDIQTAISQSAGLRARSSLLSPPLLKLELRVGK